MEDQGANNADSNQDVLQSSADTMMAAMVAKGGGESAHFQSPTPRMNESNNNDVG